MENIGRSFEKKPKFRVIALLLFLAPVTGATAGAVSVGGVPPHGIISLLLGLAAIHSYTIRNYQPPMLANVVIVLTLSFGVVVFIHTFFGSVHFSQETYIIISGLALMMGIATVPMNSGSFRAFHNGWMIAYLCSVGVALAEKYLGFIARNNYLVLNNGRAVEDIGLTSLFGNPNGFALFLVLSGLVISWQLLLEKRGFFKLLLSILSIINIFLVVETNSRTGLALVLLITIVFAWQLLPPINVVRLFILTFFCFIALFSCEINET